jgi:hypothetical protein
MKTTDDCSICKTKITGNYCSNCGQQLIHKKTSIWNLSVDLISNIFSLEKSVMSAIFIIIMHPSRIISNYWNGNRRYYPSPGKMTFYALATAALFLAYVKPNILGQNFNVNGLTSQILFALITFPMLTITSYITFIRNKDGIAKHLISILYIGSSFFILINIINGLLILIYDDILGPSVFHIFLALVFLWNAGVFSRKPTFLRITLNFILEILVFLSLVTLILFLLYLTNPDIIEY